MQQFGSENRLVRHNDLDPLLDKVNVQWSVNNLIAATPAEEKIELVGLLEHGEVLENYTSELLESVNEGGVYVVLDDVAGEDQKENVEVACLIVTELNQAVVCK